VRLPAHFCGVFGFKPTEHAVPLAGCTEDRHGGLRHLSTPGVIARDVDDLDLAFGLIEGADGRDWSVPPHRSKALPARDLRTLRIAWTDHLPGLPVTAETRDALRNLARELEQQGAKVELSVPEAFNLEAASRVYGDILGGEAGATLPGPLRWAARLASRFSSNRAPMIRGVQRGMGESLPAYLAALRRREAHVAALESFLELKDAWLLPVACGPAFTHKRPAPYIAAPLIDVDDARVSYWTYALGYTFWFNVTGGPVVVLPIGKSHEGLPIGVQVVGRRWCDREVLAVARAIATITDSFTPPPGY
jgi:amidase